MADKKEQQRRGLASKDLNSPVDSGFASGSDHVSSLLSRLSSHNSSATPPKTELNVWTVAECDASIAEMRKDMATMDKDKLVEKYPTMKEHLSEPIPEGVTAEVAFPILMKEFGSI